MKQSVFAAVIEKGIASLSLSQQKNGSFLSLTSTDENNFNNAKVYQTTFSTSLILSALSILQETPQINIVKQNAVQFLLAQKSKLWSWNYWSRESKETKTMPYPDDLDDTFCALSALFLYDKKLIDGTVLAQVVNLLTLLEIKEGGPYKTWLVSNNSKKIWRDVDLAVNSNIAYFLALNEIELPKLARFFDRNIVKSNLSSAYYPSSFPVIYFLSRFYQGKYKKNLRAVLYNYKKKNGSFGNPLNTALAVSALLNLGENYESLQSSIEFILKTETSGVWKPFGFCLDPAKNGAKYFSGSAALTTAFCLEVLAKYQKAIVLAIKNKKNAKKLQDEQALFNTILQTVETRFFSFDVTFKKKVLLLLTKLTKKRTDKHIPLLPYYFAQSLGYQKIPAKLLVQLGTANIFGWIAYTIYDDFLDDEGKPQLLSLANIALRETTTIFTEILPGNKKFQSFFQNIIDQIDAANYWEVTHCRDKNKLPNYGKYEKLAEKSFGHALGPLAILFSLGFNEKSPEVKQLMLFFKHYLIARQLSDDAHDWEKDLQLGNINPVAVLIFKITSTKASLKKMRKIFWEEVLDEVSLLMLQHSAKARRALKKCYIIRDASLLEQLIGKYEKIAQTALEEKKQTQKFFKAYKK